MKEMILKKTGDKCTCGWELMEWDEGIVVCAQCGYDSSVDSELPRKRPVKVDYEKAWNELENALVLAAVMSDSDLDRETIGRIVREMKDMAPNDQG